MRSAIAAILTLGAVLNASAGPHPITVTTSNGVPIISGQTINTNFVETTNAQPYAYETGLNLGVTDPPVIQWMDSQHLLVNCASNEACYLSYAYSLPAVYWFGFGPVTNGMVIPVSTYLKSCPQLYFRLEALHNRFYVQILPGPDGSYPTNAYMEPQWSLATGYWRPLGNLTNTWFNVFGNTFIGLQYPASSVSSTSWPCATVVEAWENTNKSPVFVTNQFYMGAGGCYQFFDASFYRRIAQVYAITNHPFPKWMVKVCDGTNTPTSTPPNYVLGNTNLNGLQGKQSTLGNGAGWGLYTNANPTNLTFSFCCATPQSTNYFDSAAGFGTNAPAPYPGGTLPTTGNPGQWPEPPDTGPVLDPVAVAGEDGGALGPMRSPLQSPPNQNASDCFPSVYPWLNEPNFPSFPYINNDGTIVMPPPNWPMQ